MIGPRRPSPVRSAAVLFPPPTPPPEGSPAGAFASVDMRKVHNAVAALKNAVGSLSHISIESGLQPPALAATIAALEVVTALQRNVAFRLARSDSHPRGTS